MPAALRGYAAQGFAHWPGGFAAALLDELRAAVDAVQAGAAALPEALRARLVFERGLPAGRRGGVPDEAVGDAIFILGEPGAFAPVFDSLLGHPAVAGAARRLLRTDAVVAHFMNVTIKHPRFGRAIAWHRDYPNGYICTAQSDFLRLMLCLDGMDAASGGTCFAPGSHRLDDAAAQLAGAPDRAPQREAEARAAGPCTPSCAPGDLVAIHPKVLHGGGMNGGARPRRNVVLQLGRAGAELVTQEREAITGRPLT